MLENGLSGVRRARALDTATNEGKSVGRVALRSAVAMVAALSFIPLLTPVSTATPGATFTGIDGGDLAAQWTATAQGPKPFDGVSSDLAVPLTMSDGTVLKADVFQPTLAGQRADGRRPVIVQYQGYGKLWINVASVLLQIPGIDQVLLPWLAQFDFPGSGLDGITDLTQQLDSGALQAASQDFELVKAGYTIVHVDLRGTGTSEGMWQVFGPRERQDSVEVMDWINAQPWSDGNIGVLGSSFTGISAMQAAAAGGDRVRAAFAMVPSGDIGNDIAMNGGAVGVGFLPAWLIVVALAKSVPDVEALLAGRFDPAQQLRWLSDRLADPITWVDLLANVYGSTTTGQFSQKTWNLVSPNGSARQALEYDPAQVSAPTFVASGSSDLFAASQTTTYNRSPLPMTKKKLILGDGYHVGGGVGGFGRPGMPPRLDVLQRAWFDHWLRGIDNGIEQYSPLTLKQPNGAWTTATSFPRQGMTYQRMYLTDRPSGTAPTALSDGGLARTVDPVVRDLTVAPSLLGICSRDGATALAGATSIIVACAEDSRIREAQGLTFTSNPVTEPTAVSGPVSVHLNAVHDTKDGYWTFTVNDVSPDGRSRQISTGQLVSSLREIDDSRSERSPNGDYSRPVPVLDFNRRQVTVPGAPVTLDIAGVPIDTTLQPGHRLRVDVFAADFPKGLPPTPILVDSQLAPQHLRLDPGAPSWVNVPLGTAIPE